MFALEFKLWIIVVGGLLDGELRIEVVCCTMTAFFLSIWGRVVIRKVKRSFSKTASSFALLDLFPALPWRSGLFWQVTVPPTGYDCNHFDPGSSQPLGRTTSL